MQSGLVALAFLFFLFFIEAPPRLNSVYLLIGFSWSLAINAPGVLERVNNRRYRFSFLRLIVRLHYYLSYAASLDTNPWKVKILRAVPSFIFCLILFVQTESGFFPLSILTFVLWELFLERNHFVRDGQFKMKSKEDH